MWLVKMPIVKGRPQFLTTGHELMAAPEMEEEGAKEKGGRGGGGDVCGLALEGPSLLHEHMNG